MLGHSLGGKVARDSIAGHPEDIAQLFVVDSLPGSRPDGRGSEGALGAVESSLGSRRASRASRASGVSHRRRAGSRANALARSR